MKSGFIAMAILATVLVQAPAEADVVLYFDLDANSGTVEPTLTASPGDTINVRLLMDLVGPAEVESFSFDIDFDPTYLTVLGTDTSMRDGLAGFKQESTIATTISGSGASVGQFGGGPDTLTGNYLEALSGTTTTFTIGEISFLASNTSNTPSSNDLLSFTNTVFVGIELGPEDTPSIFANDHNITVTAVPEPSSLAIMICSTGILAIRRKRLGSAKKNS
ncbi:hypothetical protein CA13_06210 [Planctomycetes bacterium CA13]|uniref:PEP-CTERM protein-sorting domain-containing protein n=1 Tax=Novipirellula herctigrandis TaxID=2527986 RepID=A0A5C5YXE5_9BACT|nr:hypothetical protein CA13_06210 [Planctomycetes bacterium CA13]